jgi:hypothetical protein
MIPREKLPHIYLDCGFEDYLYKSNAELAKQMLDNKITPRSPSPPASTTAPTGGARCDTTRFSTGRAFSE